MLTISDTETTNQLTEERTLNKLLKRTGILMLILMMLAFAAACGNTQTSSDSEPSEDIEESMPEAQPAENGIGIHHAEIEIQDYGTIALELDGDTAPITVQNFMDLANAGFYDGLTFHRIMDGFMIQGGDPLGNGMGGSDQNIKGEFDMNGVRNDISHVKGVISMARAQDPDSGSSQFFITVADSEFLDGQYAAFGHVTSGQDVADKIAADAQPLDDNGTIAPEDQPVITTVRIID